MAETPFEKTTLGTNKGSHPDLCDGLALFPKLGTIRAGVSKGNSGGYELGSPSPIPTLAQNVSLEGSVKFFAGVCGPAYATLFDVSGSWDELQADPNDPDSTFLGANVTIDNATLIGGLEIGATVDFSATIVLTDPYSGALEEELRLELELDAIKLVAAAIAAALGPDDGFTQLNEITGDSLLSSWGLVAEDSEPYTQGGDDDSQPPLGKIDPTYTLEINAIAVAAVVSGNEELETVIQTLQGIGIDFEVGPSLVFGLPTTVEIATFNINDHKIDNGGWLGEDESFFSEDPADAPTGSVASVERIGATLRHTVGFSFGVGLYAKLAFMKVIKVSVETPTLDLTNLLVATDPTFGPYDNTVCSVPGQGPGSDPTCPVPDDADPSSHSHSRVPEVVLG